MTNSENAESTKAKRWFHDIDWGNASQRISAFAACLSVAIAGTALWFISQQIEVADTNAKKAAALRVYMSYSEAALANPELADPKGGDVPQNSPRYKQYRLFVGHMLFAYDEMMTVFGDSDAWRASFDFDLRTHFKYICQEQRPDFFNQFHEFTRRKIREVQKLCPMVQKK